LLEAHQVARNYGERLLILNTIIYRIEKSYNLDLLKRIYADHLHLKEYSSVIFYGRKISEQIKNNDEKNLYQLLEIFFDTLSSYQLEPLGQITANFQIKLNNNLSKINNISGYTNFKILIKSYFNFLIKNYDFAKTLFDSINFQKLNIPVQLHIYFELAESLYSKSIEKYFLQMVESKYLQNEELLYYAFLYANYLQDSKSEKENNEKIIEKLNNIAKKFPDKHILKYFFSAEIYSLQLVEAANNSQEEKDIYRKLDVIITEQRSNYFLRKAVSIRAILNLMNAAKITYAHFISTNWLRFTKRDEMEFKQAQTQYSFFILNKAYQFISEKKYNYALNNFYGALSLTDDLEAHFGHVAIILESMGEEAGLKELDDRYKNLLKREFLKENYTYVTSLINTINLKNQKLKSIKITDNDYLEIISKMENFGNNQNSPLRYLLIGYCYYELMKKHADEISTKTFANFFQSAHRNFMLAYDLAQDNFRVRASALNNLGLTHYLAHNYTMSAKYWSQREKYPFPVDKITNDNNEKIAFLWFYSKSLFYSNNYIEAKNQIDKALQLFQLTTSNNQIGHFKSDSFKDQMPLIERKAFLSHYTNEFASAISLYQRLLKEKIDENNLAKIYLSLGYAFFKNKQDNEANKNLELAEKMFIKLNSKNSNKNENFTRQLLIIYGLLSQLPNSNIKYKIMRLNLLDDIYKDKITLKINKSYILTTLTKEWAQLAF
ncbi:MAG: hypothetical protein HQK51_14870, partial [Oligoflexia bacterium]|nr:hypothetical protein [Oligoflexia bacterium]